MTDIEKQMKELNEATLRLKISQAESRADLAVAMHHRLDSDMSRRLWITFAAGMLLGFVRATALCIVGFMTQQFAK